jgi:UDP-N-acetylglucosamine 2-epimerase (non-hydrolysing)
MRKTKVLSIIGTRPEVIKMAPVIRELQKRSAVFEPMVIVTGQHREMSEPYLDLFSIKVDVDLAIMQKNQTLDSIFVNILTVLPATLRKIDPDIMLVQGDTSSAFAAALAAYHGKIMVGHVEAGLRTGNKYNPFPEEMNRRLVGAVADLHFAPTENAKVNLLREGVADKHIFVTGNTVIDALRMVVRDNYEFTHDVLSRIDYDNHRVICVTTHRRESFGEPLENTLRALREIVRRHSDVEIVLPVHYNPNVRGHVYEALAGTERIHLMEPLSYEPFVQLMNKSYLILTDSGGVQEEAPGLGKPVLVLRETTERPEGLEAGTARLVGTDVNQIVSAVTELLEDEACYRKMSRAVNPYGDGKAAIRIADVIEKTFATVGNRIGLGGRSA